MLEKLIGISFVRVTGIIRVTEGQGMCALSTGPVL
jgi:hypothetical protein